MSGIERAFGRGKAFIAFLTCGDPDIETTEKVISALAEGGADIIELGIPFSDPTAEGPAIQGANLRALQGGVTTDKIFNMVRGMKKPAGVPLVIMTYANVVFSYGTARFMEAAAGAGIAGLILPDVPCEEREDFAPYCREYGLDYIPLVAPTSGDRAAMIAQKAEGFVYCVSSLGVTGERQEIGRDAAAMVRLIRAATDIPVAVGFGISTPEQAAGMAEIADGVIIGSAIVRIIEKHGRNAAPYVFDYAKSIRKSLDNLNSGGKENV